MRFRSQNSEVKIRCEVLFARVILILCMAVFISACPPVRNPVEPSKEVTFSEDKFTPGENLVYMVRNSNLSSGNVLAMDIRASSISSPAKGAAFDVDFNSTALTYSGYVPGGFFGSGSTTNAALQAGSSNKIVVGASTASAILTVTGSGTIITLKFRVTGNSSVAFSNNELKDSNFVMIPGVSWYGGTVTM